MTLAVPAPVISAHSHVLFSLPLQPAQAQCTTPTHLPTALELVAEMRACGIALNTHTYSSMLNVCVKAGELDLALDVFQQVCA